MTFSTMDMSNVWILSFRIYPNKKVRPIIHVKPALECQCCGFLMLSYHCVYRGTDYPVPMQYEMPRVNRSSKQLQESTELDENANSEDFA